MLLNLVKYATDKSMSSSEKSVYTDYGCDVLRAASIHTSKENSQSNVLLCQNGTRLVNKGESILHKLSFDTNSMAIFYCQVKCRIRI